MISCVSGYQIGQSTCKKFWPWNDYLQMHAVVVSRRILSSAWIVSTQISFAEPVVWKPTSPYHSTGSTAGTADFSLDHHYMPKVSSCIQVTMATHVLGTPLWLMRFGMTILWKVWGSVQKMCRRRRS